MGSKNACQGRNCKEKPFGTCSCESLQFCLSCYEIHCTESSYKAHSLTLLNPEILSQPQPITWKSLILTKLIYRSPEGSTEVHEGRVKDRMGKFAIKIMYCNSEGDLAKKQKESEMQMNLIHPSICQCKAAFLDESHQSRNKFVIVMEFSENGDLEQEIDKRKLVKRPWTESEIMEHLKKLIGAFAYLQDRNLTHGDIKPRNLYLTNEGKIKIGDFGESKQSMQALVTQTYQVTGTVVYFSPLLFNAYLDIIKGKNSKGDVRHNPIKSDVYSLGLTFLHMASLNKPTELNNLEIGVENLQQNVDKAIAKIAYTDVLKNVISHMLQVQENKRYDFKQLRSDFDPSMPKEPWNAEGAPKAKAANSRSHEPALISISQTQGKANVMDVSSKLITLSSHRFQSSSRAVIWNNSAIIVGGLKNSKGVFLINVSTIAPTKLAELNTGRSWHTMIIHQQKLFIIGGRSDTKEPLNSTEVFDLANEKEVSKETWRFAANLVNARENATAVSVNNFIFLIGGSEKEGNRWTQMRTIEKFIEDCWELLICELPVPCSGVGAFVEQSGNILFFGGTKEKGALSNEIYEFNLQVGEIKLSDKTLSEADSFSSQACFRIRSQVYILGNFLGIHTYDEIEESWNMERYKLLRS